MNDRRDVALQYAHENRPRFLDELKDFVRIPSVSTDPGAKGEMQHVCSIAA